MPDQDEPALLRAALEAVPFGVLILARDGQVVWRNASCETLDQCLPDCVRAAVVTGVPWTGETAWRDRTGQLVPVEVHVQTAGDDRFVVSICRLPDGRQRVEEMTRLIA